MRGFRGTYTALVTPFDRAGEVDWARFRSLLEFQADAQVDGVVVGGTSAESPTLSRDELLGLVRRAREQLPGRSRVVAAVGRNDLRASVELARAAAELGIDAAMAVDPAYNAPSSLEIRREYLVPLARRFPDLEWMSYVVPARTGTRLSAVDLALAHAEAPSIVALKDACGDPAYSREVRRHLPPPFALLSGDDHRTLEMIRDPLIRADGVVSVVSNLAPALVRRLVGTALDGGPSPSEEDRHTLEVLSGLVSFESAEPTPFGTVTVKVRNPVPVKATFALLGADLGPCRAPLGRLGPAAFDHLDRTVRAVAESPADVFGPLRAHLGSGHGALPSAVDARAGWSYDGY